MLTIFDLTLALTLTALAWGALFSRGDFRAVVLFISLGLIMAMVWVRLDAVEVALAEAAIGAGISGAMLLSALARFKPSAGQVPPPTVKRSRPKWAPALCKAGAVALFLTSGYLLLSTPPLRSGSSAETIQALPLSGVSNKVTAVLLNFRGFDTMLELTVLFLAVVATWSVKGGGVSDHLHCGSGDRMDHKAPLNFTANPVMLTLIRGVLPLAILIAGYLVWIGERAPGGAFQGGAVLGAAGVLLSLTGREPGDLLPRLLLRAVLVVGLLLFLALAALPLAWGLLFFQFPPQLAGGLILAIEAAAALSIALALFILINEQRRQP